MHLPLPPTKHHTYYIYLHYTTGPRHLRWARHSAGRGASVSIRAKTSFGKGRFWKFNSRIQYDSDSATGQHKCALVSETGAHDVIHTGTLRQRTHRFQETK
jgi:hypothetical protein